MKTCGARTLFDAAFDQLDRCEAALRQCREAIAEARRLGLSDRMVAGLEEWQAWAERHAWRALHAQDGWAVEDPIGRAEACGRVAQKRLARVIESGQGGRN